MKTVSIEQTFECSLEALLSLRKERYEHPQRYPELGNVTLLSEKCEGTKDYQVRRISLGKELPEILSTLLPQSLSSLIDKSVFDSETQIHLFSVFPENEGLRKVFSVEGKSKYSSLEKDLCQRIYQIGIVSKLFIVAGMIETSLAEVYRSTLEKDKKSIQKFFELKNQKKDEA